MGGLIRGILESSVPESADIRSSSRSGRHLSSGSNGWPTGCAGWFTKVTVSITLPFCSERGMGDEV
jgi:hypothetical protein